MIKVRNVSLLILALLGLSFHQISYSEGKAWEPSTATYHTYIETAQRLKLAQHPYWRLLLRLHDNQQSEVQDASFFLSVENSAVDFTLDVQKELAVFLQALFSPIVNEHHPICQFPLRSRWLIEQLSLPNNYFSSFQTLQCRQLVKYLNSYRTDKISILFMDERVNTIPNMMGHVALRLYSSNAAIKDKLISYVTVLHTLNPLTMVYDALVDGGVGYLGVYNFDKRVNYYVNEEKRSVFEYGLNMDKSQVYTLLLQLWEITDRDSRYAYLDYNCVTPLFDLARVADERLTHNMPQQHSIKYWYSPMEYVQFLAHNNYLKEPHNPSVYFAEEDKRMPTFDALAQSKINILDKQKTSRLSLAYENNIATANQRSVHFSFDTYGSLLSNNHRTDFTEHEIKIMGAEMMYSEEEQAVIFENLAIYSMKYLPSFQADSIPLAWQVSVGGGQYRQGSENVFSLQLLGGVGLARYLGESTFIWGLFNSHYVFEVPDKRKHHIMWSNELGLINYFDVWNENFKSSLYYWHYIDEPKFDAPYFQGIVNWQINTSYEADVSVLLKHVSDDVAHKKQQTILGFGLNYFF